MPCQAPLAALRARMTKLKNNRTIYMMQFIASRHCMWVVRTADGLFGADDLGLGLLLADLGVLRLVSARQSLRCFGD